MSKINQGLVPEPWRKTEEACLHQPALDADGRFSISAHAARLIGDETAEAFFDARAGVRSRGSQGAQVLSAPEIRRVSMAPRKLERNPFRCLWLKLRAGSKRTIGQCFGASARNHLLGKDDSRAPWRRLARRRRFLMALIVLAQTAAASWSLAKTFAAPQLGALQYGIVVTFAVLFSWISFSFWASVAGFGWLWRNGKAKDPANGGHLPLRGRTALLMPICDEEVTRCFAGVEAMYRSLAATGEIGNFDFFILSDSADKERQVEEQIAWAQTRRAVNEAERIFYRRRRVNIKRKSGNIADFLRRWSRRYDYMIVLDADSLMAGETAVRLARMMESAPQIGIIQTIPTIVNRASLFARIQQFASRVYGPLSSASLHFWQLGESAYWGHNAIIRIEPFVNYCALARLPGRAPLGGEIMSHDFIEAALMGRAGMEVWMALDVPGSYEESPPSLLDELKRDRRWCQGNLQHLRLLFADGFKTGHRAILGMGVMAYVSALLWAGFLILNIIEVAGQTFSAPNYFSSQPSLFPIWPQWHPEWAIALASTTALLLLSPKLLSFLLIIKSGDAKRFGGFLSLALSIVLEIIFSSLLAPVRMWFHSKFVVLTLLGSPINWHTQQRSEHGTNWLAAGRAQAAATLFAAGCIGAIFWINPAAFVWLLPVVVPLILSIPLSVYSSRVNLGRASRRWRLFLIPEETSAPRILAGLKSAVAKQKRRKLSGSGLHKTHLNQAISKMSGYGSHSIVSSWSAESFER